MKFSIIVPIFKVEKYLEQCIESIVNQTYKNIEIILVDDGSPDGCPLICDKWAAKDGRIRVIHKKNGGLIAARKSGVEIATGDYICFVDGDDFIGETMYERVADSVQKYNPDCVITQFYYAFPDRNEKSEYNLSKEIYSRNEIEKEIFPTMLFKERFYRFGIYPCCWTKVFKADILKKHIFDVDDRIRLGEDIAFTYPCLMECQSIAFVDKPLYYYRQNPESMTASYDPRLPDIYMLPYRALKKKSEKLGVDLSAQLPYYLLFLTNFVIRNEASRANPKSVAQTNIVLDAVVNNDYLKDELGFIDNARLPLHTKILVIALKNGRISFVNLYLKLLKRFI
ncbi:MAG: glycosyltransferase [Eubacterium sp.]|nr:glycosyltransferase [Eubacterium sp.]